MLAALLALWTAAGPGCTTNCPPVECPIGEVPEVADEALACAARGVDGGDGSTYWLMPLSPVVVSETGVVPYVLLAGNMGETPVAALLAGAAGEWFLDPDEGDPVSLKTLDVTVAPNIEAGPGEAQYYVGTLGVWATGVPGLGDQRWVNLRLELQDGGRAVTLRLRLPVREERGAELDADCWRAIMAHREARVRTWAAEITNDLLQRQAED
jgi:hypothetical protein